MSVGHLEKMVEVGADASGRHGPSMQVRAVSSPPGERARRFQRSRFAVSSPGGITGQLQRRVFSEESSSESLPGAHTFPQDGPNAHLGSLSAPPACASVGPVRPGPGAWAALERELAQGAQGLIQGQLTQRPGPPFWPVQEGHEPLRRPPQDVSSAHGSGLSSGERQRPCPLAWWPGSAQEQGGSSLLVCQGDLVCLGEGKGVFPEP